MDGLSDHNSFSEVELKELDTLPSSTNGHNPNDNLIEPNDPELEVETRQPEKRKKVSLKTVGTAITAFLGVPEERNPTSYDPSGPRVRVVMKYFKTVHLNPYLSYKMVPLKVQLNW